MSESQKGKTFYIALGIKWEFIPDKESEADNPAKFNSLETAIKVAKENSEEFSYGAVAEVRILEEYATPPKDNVNRG